MANNNEHWNTVDWSQIPGYVEAVVTFSNKEPPTYYLMEDGVLMCECYRGDGFDESGCSDMDDLAKNFSDRLHLRPIPSIQPTPEPPESTQVETSESWATTTPEFNWSSVDSDVEAVVLYPDNTPDFYKHIDGKLYVQFRRGEQYFRSDYDTVSKMFEDYDEGRILIRPLPETTTHDEPPSISTILQEAQQYILKHHGVTGEVKFTIKCR